MYNSLFLIPILTGSIFIVVGIIMLIFPPKKINWFYGYRTSSSMKNQERWDFAQVYSAKEMVKSGGLLILTSFIGFFYKPNESTAVVLEIGILIIMVTILVIRVERAIKKKF